MDFVTFIRWALLCVLAIVLVGIGIQMLFTFNKMSRGQRFYTLGTYLLMIYAADGMHEAIVQGLHWRFRLVFAFWGLVLLAGYLTEPWEMRKSRIGRRMMEQDVNRDEPESGP